jgi:hypothetical protein
MKLLQMVLDLSKIEDTSSGQFLEALDLVIEEAKRANSGQGSRRYWIYWTYHSNYGKPHVYVGEGPEDAIRKAFEIYSDSFKQYAVFHVFSPDTLDPSGICHREYKASSIWTSP